METEASAIEEFTFTNSNIAETDIVSVGTTYAGGGLPLVTVKGIAAGSCTVAIINLHAADPLDAVLVVNFSIQKAVAE